MPTPTSARGTASPHCEQEVSTGIVRSSEPRLWPFPLRIVIEREDLLDAFGTGRAAVEQHLQRLADSRQARLVACFTGAPAAVDAVEDGGQVEDLAPRL